VFDSVIRSVPTRLHYMAELEGKKLYGMAECYGGIAKTTEGGNDRQPPPPVHNEVISCSLSKCLIIALSP